MKRLAILLLLVSASAMPAQPMPEAIRFPVVVVPAPTPGAVSKLGANSLYVIDSDVPIQVGASPLGLVTVTEEAGPIKIRSVFADSGGKVETRTFRGKQVFIVEAVSRGTVELIIVPASAKSSGDWIRKSLEVDAQNPQPPPDPPTPDPDPKPPTPTPSPIPLAGFRVMIVEDKAKLSLMPESQLEIRTSPIVRDWLDANCIAEPMGGKKAYRIWDYKTTSVGQKEWQDVLLRPRASMPWIVISNGVTGYEGPLPANVEDTITLLKKIKGAN